MSNGDPSRFQPQDPVLRAFNWNLREKIMQTELLRTAVNLTLSTGCIDIFDNERVTSQQTHFKLKTLQIKEESCTPVLVTFLLL